MRKRKHIFNAIIQLLYEAHGNGFDALKLAKEVYEMEQKVDKIKKQLIKEAKDGN